MRAEHTTGNLDFLLRKLGFDKIIMITGGGSDFEFVTPNYNVKTQARKEWLYAAPPPSSQAGCEWLYGLPCSVNRAFLFISCDLGTSLATGTGKLSVPRLPI